MSVKDLHQVHEMVSPALGINCQIILVNHDNFIKEIRESIWLFGMWSRIYQSKRHTTMGIHSTRVVNVVLYRSFSSISTRLYPENPSNMDIIPVLVTITHNPFLAKDSYISRMQGSNFKILQILIASFLWTHTKLDSHYE